MMHGPLNIKKDLAPKTIKLKRGDIQLRIKTDLMAILWRDKRDICMLTNIHDVPAEGNFCSEGGKSHTATNFDSI